MKKLILIVLGILLYSSPPVSLALPVSVFTPKYSGSQSDALSEEEKVQHLINYIRALNGAVFIRNGKEFSPGKAADHLHKKWEKHKKRVKTAQGFVSRLATASTTNEPYQIRFGDGNLVKCGDLLNEELRRVEQ